MVTKHYKYKAFISYSHKDEEWGVWLHRALENYKVPWGLLQKKSLSEGSRAKLLPKRLYPIFRDREELPSSATLGEVINQALKDSSHLVVVCSPRAAQSRWVNEEIMEFKRLGKADSICCLIVDGQPNASQDPNQKEEECFPVAVMYEVDENGALTDRATEPIAADAREGKDGKANALLKLVAGLLGVGFDDLKQRESARLQKRMAVITGLSLALVALVVGLSIWVLLLWAQTDQQEEALSAALQDEGKFRKQARIQSVRAEVFQDATAFINGRYWKNDRTLNVAGCLGDIRAYLTWAKKWETSKKKVPSEIIDLLRKMRGELVRMRARELKALAAKEGEAKKKAAVQISDMDELEDQLRDLIYYFESNQ